MLGCSCTSLAAVCIVLKKSVYTVLLSVGCGRFSARFLNQKIRRETTLSSDVAAQICWDVGMARRGSRLLPDCRCRDLNRYSSWFLLVWQPLLSCYASSLVRPDSRSNSFCGLVPALVRWSAWLSFPGTQANLMLADAGVSRSVAIATPDRLSLITPSEFNASYNDLQSIINSAGISSLSLVF